MKCRTCDRPTSAAMGCETICISCVVELRDLRTRVAELEKQKDGAYEERNRCVALIAAMARSLGCTVGLGEHDTNDASWDPEWRTIVYVDLPTGQTSFHVHAREKEWFQLPPYAGTWDGHTTPEKYDRVMRAAAAYATAADGAISAEDIEECSVTEREGAINTLAKIMTMTEHDSPIYQVAAVEHAALVSQQRAMYLSAKVDRGESPEVIAYAEDGEGTTFEFTFEHGSWRLDNATKRRVV